MLSSIEQNNSVQRFSAVNAFRSNKTPLNGNNTVEKPTAEGTNTASAKTLLDRIDVNDVRECAKAVGEFNISDEDIKYGLLYGRSVIAEYLC